MKPYTPDELPLNNLDYQFLFSSVGDANAELARYDGLLQGIPNPGKTGCSASFVPPDPLRLRDHLETSPLIKQEAVLSSKIEGTQATVDEVLEQEAGLIKEGEKYKDIQEISNYSTALLNAINYLRDYPIRQCRSSTWLYL